MSLRGKCTDEEWEQLEKAIEKRNLGDNTFINCEKVNNEEPPPLCPMEHYEKEMLDRWVETLTGNLTSAGGVQQKDSCFYPTDTSTIDWDKIITDSFEKKEPIDVPKNLKPTDFAKESLDYINKNHYSSKAIQPLEYIIANKLDFIEGNIIKYVTRYKEKNGMEDLLKAKDYLETLIKNYK